MRTASRFLASCLFVTLIAGTADACTGCVHGAFVADNPQVPFWTFLFQTWAIALIIEWRLAETSSPNSRLRALTSGYLIALVWYPVASLIAATFTVVWEKTAYRTRRRARPVWSADALLVLAALVGWLFYYPTYLLIGRVPPPHFFWSHVPPPHFLMVFLPAIPGLVLLSVYLVRTGSMKASRHWSAAMLVLCGISPLIRDPSYAAAWAYFFGDPPAHFGEPGPWPGDAASLAIVAVSQYVLALLPLVCGVVLWRLDRDDARRVVNRRVFAIACVVTAALVATRLFVEIHPDI